MQNKLTTAAFSTSPSAHSAYSALDAVCGGNVLANNKTYASEQINMISHDLLSHSKWRSIIFILSYRANTGGAHLPFSARPMDNATSVCVLLECWCAEAS
jgi:hypothetical protein